MACDMSEEEEQHLRRKSSIDTSEEDVI